MTFKNVYFNDDLAEKIRIITKELRMAYYQNSSAQSFCDTIPFGGSIRESIGPFPEFILKGRFCKRSGMGLCSPCFYSRLPEHTLSEKSFNDGYLSQVDYIVDNFDSLVIKNQVGKVANLITNDKPVYGIVCTPTGSYFDSTEYPVIIRKTNLQKLLDAAERYHCEIALHIETHVEDVLSYFEKPDEEEIELLRKLNARVILGFESSDSFSRNVVYNKDLNLYDFEIAVKLLKNHGFPTGAFVFAGLFAYNDSETIQDVRYTFSYLKKLSVSPVIMFANTQKYTIPDVLLSLGQYKLIDAHTVLEITKMIIEIFGCNMKSTIDPWLIADPKGGPPDPNMHIFNVETNTSCAVCSEKIYNAIEQLRITKNEEAFLQAYRSINNCECHEDYIRLLNDDQKQSSQSSISERVANCVYLTYKYKDYYILKENPWIVKAELLCYGLNLSEEQLSIAQKNNPYICEKGLINAVHIVYKGLIINICVAEKFCNKSPYTADYRDNKWFLLKNGVYIGDFSFIDMPSWCLKTLNGETIGKALRPHSTSCLSIWPSTNCVFVNEGKGCKFCGLNSHSTSHQVMKSSFIISAIEEAFKFNKEYEINISGGTLCSPDYSIEYLISLCTKIKEINKSALISVECAPPSDNKLLLSLHECGVSAVIMNLEIYDDKIRNEICPGKSTISRNRYFEALSFAVSIFGKGNVSSVLIMGLQPKDDVITAAEKLISIGTIPTIMPFKPLDNTALQNYPLPDPKEYMEISRRVAELMKYYGLEIKHRSGCASCGACSLEINLS